MTTTHSAHSTHSTHSHLHTSHSLHSHSTAPVRFSGPLRCIFFAQFDTVKGPTLYCQSPQYVTPALFDTISPFIITSPELTHKLITLSLSIHQSHYRILAYPMSLSDVKYARNQLLFSVCFAFDGECGESYRIYQPALRKLAQYIETLEIDSEYLHSPVTKRQLPELLHTVYSQLSTEGQCTVKANAANRIFLRLYPHLPPPPAVSSWQVPVLLRGGGEGVLGWDMTLRSLMSAMDGESCVGAVAARCGVRVSSVKRAVAQLLYGGLAVCIDAFQYTNLYLPTAALIAANSNAQLCADAVEYVQYDKSTQQRLTGWQVLGMYGRMSSNECMEQYMARERLAERGVDVRRLVRFGAVNGLIRRVHVYPTLIITTATRHSHPPRPPHDNNGVDRSEEKQKQSEDVYTEAEEKDATAQLDEQEEAAETGAANDSGSVGRASDALLWRKLLPLCDGRRSMDELCYRVGVSQRTLLPLLKSDPHIVFIHTDSGVSVCVKAACFHRLPHSRPDAYELVLVRKQL